MNGCHNTERESGYWVRDGIVVKGHIAIQLMRYVKDEMSKECRYDGKATDKKCEGCLK